MVDNDIKAGIVKPLKANVFDARDVEQAFRFMASGKHIGKVLLKVRSNPSDVESLPIAVLPRVYCDGLYIKKNNINTRNQLWRRYYRFNAVHPEMRCIFYRNKRNLVSTKFTYNNL